MANKEIANKVKMNAGVDVSHCYQCGKCTAGCVQAQEMDYPPSFIMRLLQTGTEENYEKVLKSRSIWVCLNCENCYQRCPQSIDIPSVMDALRCESLKKGMTHKDAKKIIAFHRSFLSQVKNTGRLWEVGMEAEYKMRTMDLFQDVDKVPAMLSKGKLHILPEKMAGKADVKKIFDQTVNKK
ncbi:MAG: 4Fe-4S dicluster domain-containing protein [Flavobacteriales bacterium]|nr:4Fe-4S dicluster domain-containing protein [Flavobacteriales bacterium]